LIDRRLKRSDSPYQHIAKTRNSCIILVLLSSIILLAVINADNKMITGGVTGWIIWIYNAVLYYQRNAGNFTGG